jgi:DNA-directed RNA polymerase II subunit RPB9
MSSPAASVSGDRKKPAEQITFRFCSECSNMLYPKEDELERKLMFTCRTCNFSEEATSSCIFRNAMNNAAGETAGVTQDVGSDPTVGSPFISWDEEGSGLRGSAAPGLPVSSRSSRSSSSSTSSACVSTCLGCGRIIVSDTCGDHFSMLREDHHTPELDLDDASIPGFDQDTDMDDADDLHVDLDDVEISHWTGESLDELTAFMGRTEDFFGLGETDLGMGGKVDSILADPVSSSSALAQG